MTDVQAGSGEVGGGGGGCGRGSVYNEKINKSRLTK